MIIPKALAQEILFANLATLQNPSYPESYM